MEEKQIDAYIVPSADNHQSEYVGEHFKSRAFITGFTGSAGTAVITKDDAGLWTDGRYFIQAESQLSGSGITLYRMGNAQVPTCLLYTSVFFASPAVKQVCPNSAACWSPAAPAIGISPPKNDASAFP